MNSFVQSDKNFNNGQALRFSIDRWVRMDSIGALMNELQAERIMKAIVDGVEEYAEIAARAGAEPADLVEQAEVLDRAIQLMRGFYKYGHENMKPAGLPPPKNPYFDGGKGLEEQGAEYFAYEAVQRNNMDRARCIWTCGQLGLDADAAETAIDNVCMPWRAANGWRTYVREVAGRYVLQDKPPVKLKRHLERFLEALSA
jgi:hypothetical protein